MQQFNLEFSLGNNNSLYSLYPKIDDNYNIGDIINAFTVTVFLTGENKSIFTLNFIINIAS